MHYCLQRAIFEIDSELCIVRSTILLTASYKLIVTTAHQNGRSLDFSSISCLSLLHFDLPIKDLVTNYSIAWVINDAIIIGLCNRGKIQKQLMLCITGNTISSQANLTRIQPTNPAHLVWNWFGGAGETSQLVLTENIILYNVPGARRSIENFVYYLAKSQ